jgi:hypothetical protein
VDEISSTPFLDFFRRGEVAPDVRMLAAQGALAPRAHEQLALLVLLTGDTDPAIRQTAEHTISRIPPALLSAFLARPDVDPEIKDFFVRRAVVPADAPALDAERPLVAAVGEPIPEPEPEVAPVETSVPDATPPDALDEAAIAAARERIPTVQRLSLMNITERIKVAMRGSREERMVLIRDPNKLVSLAVLASPKVTEQEIASFARLGAVSEDVLRVIGTSRSWIKTYAVVAGLVFNPKTPVAISMGFVNRLTERDVRVLATDRNVPEPLRILARKMLSTGKSRRQ